MKRVLVQGVNKNRAVDGDLVAVEIFSKEDWASPSGHLVCAGAQLTNCTGVMRDDSAGTLVEGGQVPDGETALDSVNKQVTGRVVGIVKRNWRHYCGTIMPPQKSHVILFEFPARPLLTLVQQSRVLFMPEDRNVPRVRITTQQVDNLLGMRVIVAIDSWPQKSKYPHGHFVRIIGPVGDAEAETEVVLIEHDVPYQPFSKAVLGYVPSCVHHVYSNVSDLPTLPWGISDEELGKRRDFRDLDICSIDPPGCTDIDDALHCRQLENGNFEVHYLSSIHRK